MAKKINFFCRDLLIQFFAVTAFVLLCFFMQRSLSAPESCVHSSFVAYARLGDLRLENCAFESRLLPNRESLTPLQRRQLREISSLETLLAAFPKAEPTMSVALALQEPSDLFAHRSALIAVVLKNQAPEIFADEEELALISDFLNWTLFGASEGGLPEKFHTVQPKPTKLRQLLALGLYRIYQGLPLREKFAVMARLRSGEVLPELSDFPEPRARPAAEWLTAELKRQAEALQLTKLEGELAVRRALLELGIEAPTRWELTMDLTHTPAWRAILEQMVKRSQFRSHERVLIFTPEGEVALPSRSAVEWQPKDVRSQKHVLLACHWPGPGEAINVEARRLFAEQSCDKLKSYFWD